MHVAGVQIDIAWEDKPANHAKVRALAAGVPAGSLIVLPEMFSTGFSMNVEGIHEGEARASERFLAELAKERKSTVLGGVVTRPAGGRGRNEALLVGSDGAEAARYAKIHPFSYAGETDHYEPGREVVVAPVGGLALCPLVCYDLRFPEAFRQGVRRGAELFVVIANWPAPREEHWTTLLRARAIENQAYVVGVNRVGRDPKLAYSGRSMIIDPRGTVLADGGSAEGVVRAELDPASLRAWRRDFPALSDIRSGWIP